MTMQNKSALDGLRVVDAATLFAGPVAASLLGDFGADVVKIEHPQRPDPARGHGPEAAGHNLWWKTLGRNKRTMTLNLSKAEGQEIFRRLIDEADVLIENFRPGTLERWGIGPEELMERNPRLVTARVTGFGQVGPYKRRPGFGTLAEAMSGFAALTGEPDGPPTLPPFGLGDGIAGLSTAYAVMAAIHARAASGRGQVIDVALIEPIMSLLGPQITRYDTLGSMQQRLGNRSSANAPRNTYKTADGKWVAVSTSARSIAERVMRLVGRGDLVDEHWFATGKGRVEHADELDGAVEHWVRRHTLQEVVQKFEAVEAAVAPVYDAADIVADPQFAALGTIQKVEDPDLGSVAMQNVIFRMSETPGAIRWPGRGHGADTEDILREMGVTDIASLREKGVV